MVVEVEDDVVEGATLTVALGTIITVSPPTTSVVMEVTTGIVSVLPLTTMVPDVGVQAVPLTTADSGSVVDKDPVWIVRIPT